MVDWWENLRVAEKGQPLVDYSVWIEVEMMVVLKVDSRDKK